MSGPLTDGRLPAFLAARGAALAGVESCLGPWRREELLALADPGLDTETQARLLLERVVCPHRSRTLRRARLRARVLDTQARAVVYLRQTFCDPGAYDSLTAADVAREAGVPFLEVDADFPFELDGPLRTRLEAFLEAHDLGGPEDAESPAPSGDAPAGPCAPGEDAPFLDADLYLDPSEA